MPSRTRTCPTTRGSGWTFSRASSDRVPRRMKAVVYEDVGRVAVADVADPEIEEPRDAIVRVTRTAICGSDLHFFHGKAPLDPGETIGHEAVGVVEATGPGVRGFAPGARVVVAFDIVCGECWFCRRGQTP